MGALIIELSEYRARKGGPSHTITEPVRRGNPMDRFHFWSGASGKRYVHTIYSLIECPAVPASNYVLVKRDDQGNRRVLSIGRVCNEATSLNLAEIRHRGAQLGANEVHVHLLADTDQASKLVEFDLRSGQMATANVLPQSCS